MFCTGSIPAALGVLQGKALDQKNNFAGFASSYTGLQHYPVDNDEEVREILNSPQAPAQSRPNAWLKLSAPSANNKETF